MLGTRVTHPRLTRVSVTPVSVALEMPTFSATRRVSMLSQIHSSQSTRKPVQVRSCGRSTVLVRC